MYLDIDDPQAMKIRWITLDGKPIKMAVAFDDEAGWIDIMIPVVPKLEKENEGIYKDVGITYDRKRLFGKVEVTWYE